VSGALLIAGGAIFLVLGVLHALYTFAGYLAPHDAAVSAAMSKSAVRLARCGTTMWRAWLGFNYSHSLGAALFGLLCATIGIALPSELPKAALFVLLAVAAIYLWLALRYWFRIPVVAIGLANLCLFLAWLAY